MQIIQYEKKYAGKVATLLNNYLPFQVETAETVEAAGGIRILCVEEEEVIGYIAGYEVEDFYQDFPYFEEQLLEVKQLTEKGVTYYTSHFVVNPSYRGRGIGTQLVEAYMKQTKALAKSVVVVGWVQSDINKWTAQKQFIEQGLQSVVYIDRYFEPYDVYCPNCNGRCYCDAHIVACSF